MKNHLKTSLITLSFFSCFSAFAATMVSADDPQRILDLAKGYGSAELGKDSTGDPKVIGRINGTRYGIFFYGCNNGKSCDDIQFRAAWDKDGVSWAAINEWNRKFRFGKAYLDSENDPVLEMNVNIDYGVSRENLDDTFDWWSKTLARFEETIIEGK